MYARCIDSTIARRLAGRFAVPAFGLVLSIGTSACESADRREAQSVAQAVERYRRAENVAKPSMADALRAASCSAPDVCRARDACLASADATSKALRLKDEVAQAIGALEQGKLPKESPEAQALPKKLDEAEALLKQGLELLGPCDDQVQALKRKHGF